MAPGSSRVAGTRWIALVCSGLGASAWTATAHAQSSLQGTGSVALTWTDNVLNAPDSPAPGSPIREAAWSLALSPGIRFDHRTSRAEYTASYGHPIRIYLDRDVPVEQSEVMGLTGTFALSERDQLTLGATTSHALTSDALSVPSERATTAPTPAGRTRILSFSANESFTRALSETWSLGQLASFAHTTPIDDPEDEPANYTTNAGLTLSHDRPRDTYGADLDVSYLGSSREPTPAEADPARWSGSIVGRWSHQYSESVSSQLTAGSGLVFGGDGGLIPSPLASATLQHARGLSSQSITASRTLEPDVLTGVLFLVDSVRADLVLALEPTGRLSGRASTGLSSNRAVASDAITEDVKVWTSEVGLDWGFLPGLLGASVVYQYQQQWSASDSGDLADFSRNQVMLVVGGQFPRQGFQLRGTRSIGVTASERPIGGSLSAVSAGSRTPRGQEARGNAGAPPAAGSAPSP